MLERICYSYQSHEYPPLGAWEAIDRLSKCVQPPKDVDEPAHYKSVKTLVEVAKVSGVNFAMLCTYNIDYAMKALYSAGDISSEGTYDDGTKMVRKP